MAGVRSLPVKLTPANPFPPDCAARFSVVRSLGEGGFGAVFLARQVSLDRHAAVKVLLADVLSDTEQVERFVNEARITASVNHPNVVNIYDQGAEYGIPWIAYEYLEGRSLRDMLQEAGLTVEMALDAACQVAMALEAAHAHHVLHRDIKPDNVLAVEIGRYKVADFGLAKWSREGAVRTATGLVLGTPEYLAPELIMGEPASVQSDIYALGVTLFELLTGSPPFTAAAPAQVLRQHLEGTAPAPGERRRGVSEQLDGIVIRCLAKEPARRYRSAAELLRALEQERGSSVPVQAAGAARLETRSPAVDASPPTQVLATRAARGRATIQVGPPALVGDPLAPQPGRFAHASLLALGTLTVTLCVIGAGWRLGRGGALTRFPTSVPSSPTPPVSTPSPRPLPSIDRATPSPAANSGSGHAGTEGTAPGWFTGGWEKYEALLPRLRSGGEVAERSVALLRREHPIDLGKSPVGWAKWIELNEWLSDPSRSWPSPAPTKRFDDFFGRLGEDVATLAFKQLTTDLTAESVAGAIAGVTDGPEDGRRWLVLGRLLERDGRPDAAKRVYARGIAALNRRPFIGHSWVVWDALGSALLAIGGPRRLADDYLSYVADEPDPNVIWWGLRETVRGHRLPVETILDLATRAKDDPRLGAAARVSMGKLQCDGYGGHAGDPDAALATWRTGLERFGADAGLRDAIIDFYMARGDLRDAITYRRDDAQGQGWQATTAMETVSAIDEGMHVRAGGLEGKRSALFLAYLFRLLESDAQREAARELAACSEQGFWAGDLLTIALELDGRGAAPEWSRRFIDRQLTQGNPNWSYWNQAAGAFPGPAGESRWLALRAAARVRWPSHASETSFQVWDALRLSRQGDDAGAMERFDLAAATGINRRIFATVFCEILGRPIWKRALGVTEAGAAAIRAMRIDIPVEGELIVRYWHCLQRGDLDGAAAAGEKLFWASPDEPVWSLVAVWNAARKKDAPGLTEALARGRLACRHNRSGIWPLREMAQIEREFGPHGQVPRAGGAPGASPAPRGH